jgi:hypothetical protein
VSSWFSTLCLSRLAAAGVTDPGDLDIFTAIVGGLFNQQQTALPTDCPRRDVRAIVVEWPTTPAIIGRCCALPS